jgi:hypothetical protein
LLFIVTIPEDICVTLSIICPDVPTGCKRIISSALSTSDSRINMTNHLSLAM